MSDPQSKEFVVIVQIGKTTKQWPIKAPNKNAAEAHAKMLLKHTKGNGSVIKTEEKKP